MFDDHDNDILTLTVVEEGTDNLPPWAVMQSDTLVCEPLQADTGCVNIVVTAEDDSGSMAADTFSICVEDYLLAVGDPVTDKFDIHMYPNPTRDLVNIKFSSGFHKVGLSVMDITGKIVLQKMVEAGEKITFNMADKISGMYLVKLDIDGRQVIKKLVLNKTKY
jgi:hypothetical protein